MALPQPERVAPTTGDREAVASDADGQQRLRLMRPETSGKPPILEVLPAALRREAFPVRCVCPHCAPELNDVQRAAYERVERDWRVTRIFWCDANDYQLVDLIRAEQAESAAAPPARPAQRGAGPA